MAGGKLPWTISATKVGGKLLPNFGDKLSQKMVVNIGGQCLSLNFGDKSMTI